MSLLVLAYPKLEKREYEWIQSYRQKYDERYYNMVKPHFTLVFPVSNCDEKLFIEHAQKKVKKFKEFFFVLRCAQIVKDPFSNYTDVFLIPEEGYRIFVKLHDALYTDLLEKELRLDIPFIPHLGIAGNENAVKCKTIADKINLKHLEIVGSIKDVDVVSYNNQKVTTLNKISFK
jgi:hypothetical protein